MKFIFSYMRKYRWFIALIMLIKTVATFLELMLPYVLEHLIDNVAPKKDTSEIVFWGVAMLLLAGLIWFLNIKANRSAVKVSKDAAYEIRRDLFRHSINLSGSQMDEFGLPSLTSRMTSDSYNLQDFVRMFQTIGIRAPLMMIGGIIVTLTMDVGLSAILCVVVPVLLLLVVGISMKGIPLYVRVQQSVDSIVRVMRENITGIRVVKALSKEDYEMRRFDGVNSEMNRRECKAGVIMSLPGPTMTLFLNVSLTLVVLVGARRVNSGLAKPGVILAFLTYFNLILQGVMGFNRVILMMSKANASANRVAAVIQTEEELFAIPESEAAHTDGDAYILFDNVSFRYGAAGSEADAQRRLSLDGVSFSMKKGGSLGIIGPTGCGKTTIINLLMRFYDATAGHVFIDGKDVRTYDKDTLHSMFGTVFQNDVIFADTLAENISFGRDVDADAMRAAVTDARALDFVEAYEDGYQHKATVHGSNLSGGQRQRILISRALAANPEILIFDDASSALDYQTDALLRKAIREHHSGVTTITVAQRVSSIMSMDEILVMDDGKIIGKGDHETLLRTCPEYLEIYKTQMGEEE